MSRRQDDLELELSVLATKLRTEDGGHPEPERIIALYRRELSAPDEEAVLDHIAVCPECARQRLELPALLERELESSNTAGSKQITGIAGGSNRKLAASLAACLLVALIGWSLWHRSGPALDPGDPRVLVNPTVVVLHLNERLRGPEPPAVAESNSLLQVVLLVEDLDDDTTYRVEVIRRGGELTWRSADLEALGDEISLVFEPGVLIPGEYTFKVIGLTNGVEATLGSQDLEVRK